MAPARVAPVAARARPGDAYNREAGVGGDGSDRGMYGKPQVRHVGGFGEKFYFRPGKGGYPVFETGVGKVGVYICYDRHFPEGWRALGLNGAEIVFNPSATARGLSQDLWRREQPAPAAAHLYLVGPRPRRRLRRHPQRIRVRPRRRLRGVVRPRHRRHRRLLPRPRR